MCLYHREVTYSGHFVLRYSHETFFCHLLYMFRRLCPLTCVCVSQPPRGYIFWSFRSLLFRHIPFSHVCTLLNTHFCSCGHCHVLRHATHKKGCHWQSVFCHYKDRPLKGNCNSSAATLAYQTNRAAAYRARETPQGTEARFADQRNRAAASTAGETPHETVGIGSQK